LKKAFVDGKRVITLAPGKYRLKATHADYQDSAEQIVEIKPGDTTPPTPVQFQLTPIVRKASFSVSAAPAETEVLVDGAHIGVVTAAGTFTSELSPGHHTVTLRKPGYEESSANQNFNAGEVFPISGESVKPFGTLAFHVSPVTARVLYRREGEAGFHDATNGQSVALNSGKYEVMSDAGDRYSSVTAPFNVTAGKTTQVDLILPESAKPTEKVSTPASVFEPAGAWTVAASAWWVHTAPGYTFMRDPKGTFTFDILKQTQKGGLFHKGPRKVVFVADYHTDQDRILYTLDEHQLRRKVSSPSGDSPEKKIAHGMENAPSYRITVELASDRIIIRNRANTVLDEVKRTSPGKFGFLDEVSLVLSGAK
jgi:hypothetical protein